MHVLYLGTYERDYPRNTQVISCLRKAGFVVSERHVSVWEGQRDKYSPSVRSLARLGLAQLRLAATSSSGADVVVVGYPGHVDMPAARLVARRRPVVLNPLVSLEDTIVSDRQLASRRSLTGRAVRLVDRVAFRMADLVVMDTETHAAYVKEQFRLQPDRVASCFVGAEDRLFFPGSRQDRNFSVLFVGKLIPLHGLETILTAAALCPDVQFRLVGSGQLDQVLSDLPANVNWRPWIGYRELPSLYRSAGCALGIFGTSEKAARVIPNKAFQALATGTPLVTADSPASRELLENGHDALLVPAGDANALATAIQRLAASTELRTRIGARGRSTYERHASEVVLGECWRRLLEGVVARKSHPG